MKKYNLTEQEQYYKALNARREWWKRFRNNSVVVLTPIITAFAILALIFILVFGIGEWIGWLIKRSTDIDRAIVHADNCNNRAAVYYYTYTNVYYYTNVYKLTEPVNDIVTNSYFYSFTNAIYPDDNIYHRWVTNY